MDAKMGLGLELTMHKEKQSELHWFSLAKKNLKEGS